MHPSLRPVNNYVTTREYLSSMGRCWGYVSGSLRIYGMTDCFAKCPCHMAQGDMFIMRMGYYTTY